ncbi:MAG: hypothetical protein H0U57_04010 [Tatlockia sp.]|nr:hypothetical protein [Tatlockia sp.]
MKERIEPTNLLDLSKLDIQQIGAFLNSKKDKSSYSQTCKQINSFLQTNLMDMSELEIQHIGSFLNSNKDKSSYARTSKQIHSFFQSDLDEVLLQKLQEAVLNDGNMPFFNDKQTVKNLLDKYPLLLIKKPRKSSTLTLILGFSNPPQTFHAEETTFTLALKLKRLDMVQLILPYFNKLDDGKAIALSQWKTNEITDKKKEAYGEIMNGLVREISKETFSGDFSKSVTNIIVYDFIAQLTTNVNVSSNNYFDVEHLLVAAYQADYLSLNQPQKKLYSLVLGLIKNSLPPEIRLYLANKNALLHGNEIITNRKICSDFIEFVDKRDLLLQELKSKLLNDFLDETFANIDPRSSRQSTIK